MFQEDDEKTPMAGSKDNLTHTTKNLLKLILLKCENYRTHFIVPLFKCFLFAKANERHLNGRTLAPAVAPPSGSTACSVPCVRGSAIQAAVRFLIYNPAGAE